MTHKRTLRKTLYGLSKRFHEHPSWVRGRVSWDRRYKEVRSLLEERHIKTVCIEAACPNKGECWENGHLTFMILGDKCTRGCLFCNVEKGVPEHPDPSEASNIAEAVKELGIKYAVITSVTRDDLEDKGAMSFIRAAEEIKSVDPDIVIELLIPDLGADPGLLERIAFSGAEVIGHNIEIPARLYPPVRPLADYDRSLEVLKLLRRCKENGARILIKSSLVLGLGERKKDITRTLNDLEQVGVDIVYMGQYLRPSKKHWPVKKYYSPEEFEAFTEEAYKLGFSFVLAGPMVRSSYKAYDSCSSALAKSGHRP